MLWFKNCNKFHLSSSQGLGKKANDSLDMMFDTTAYGEYKSYNSSHLGQSQPYDDDADDDEEEEEEAEEEHSGGELLLCLTLVVSSWT